MTGKLGVYRRLFSFLRPYPWQFGTAYVAMLGATLLNLFVPQIIKGAIDRGLEENHPTALFVAAGLIMAIAVVRGGAGFLQRYFGEWMTHRVAYDLRDTYYIALQELPFSFYDRRTLAHAMSRATGDISETERFAGTGMVQL